jgi:hypothetical protein
MRLVIRLDFGSREPQIIAAEAPPHVTGEAQAVLSQLPPYRFPTFTSPAEPTLIESSSFAKFG